MLKWAVIFLIISLVAGAIGLTPIARGAATISKLLFGVAIVMFLIFLTFLVIGLMAVDAVT